MRKHQWKNVLTGFTLLYLVWVIGYALYDTPLSPPDEVPGEQGTVSSDNTPPPTYTNRPALLAQGTKAPDFSLKTLKGQSFSLAQTYAKQPVLIEFFATWCSHCQDSTPALKTLHQKNLNTLTILAINAGDKLGDPSTSQAFQQHFQTTYPILERPSDALLAAYHFYAFPTFYLVDTNGTIVWSSMGTLTLSDITELHSIIQEHAY